MAQQDNNKIVKYRSPLNINIGMIIFGVLFIYVIVCIILYVKTEHLNGYEVKMGALSVNNVYHGIVLRNEEIYPANDAGYVYYFAPEATHVACGDLIYSIDSSGVLAENLVSNNSQAELTNSDMAGLRNKIMNYRSNFDKNNFSTVYDFKYTLQSEVAKLSNSSMLETIDNMAGASGIGKNYAPMAGTILFGIDGFENIIPSQITEEHFDEQNYDKKQYVSGDLVGKGDPIFKLVKSEDWDVVIEVEKDRIPELEEAGYVKVRFLEDQFETWGKITVMGSNEEDTKCFVGLSFTNSMVDYATDRFLDLELILEEETGLKIPNSSIAERNFYLVDEKYMVKGVNGKDGVMRQTFTEDNEITTEFVETTVYNIEDEIYYLDEAALSIGDVLYAEESVDTMTVSKQASLVGVYNINKGYADFKQIIILYQNDEYSIVESNTKYGLNAYDYIALDASTVVNNQFVHDR